MCFLFIYSLFSSIFLSCFSTRCFVSGTGLEFADMLEANLKSRTSHSCSFSPDLFLAVASLLARAFYTFSSPKRAQFSPTWRPAAPEVTVPDAIAAHGTIRNPLGTICDGAGAELGSWIFQPNVSVYAKLVRARLLLKLSEGLVDYLLNYIHGAKYA